MINDKQQQAIQAICRSLSCSPSSLASILHKVQAELGYLSEEVQQAIACELNIPVAKVQATVAFYASFATEPKAKHSISVCLGTACHIKESGKVVAELKELLGIEVGATTPDGKFSLNRLRCIGACGLAPVIMVDEKVYARVKVSEIKNILAAYE